MVETARGATGGQRSSVGPTCDAPGRRRLLPPLPVLPSATPVLPVLPLVPLVLLVLLLGACPGEALAAPSGGGGPSGAWGPWMGDLPLPPGDRSSTLLGGELGWEQIDGESFVGLLLQGSYRGDRLRLGLEVPLRLDLQHDGLRDADWDEPGDAARLLRLAELGEPGDPLHVRLGQLSSVSLGHGTLLGQYFGVLDPDRPHAGLWVDGRYRMLGAEALLDDLLAPSLLGGRLFLLPGSTGSGSILPERLQLGLTMLSDLDAPRELARRCPAGAGRPGGGGCTPAEERLEAGDAGLPRVARSEALVLGGVDVTLGLVDRTAFQLLSYADLNAIFGSGAGLHTGLMIAVRQRAGMQGALRLEYRYAGPGYRPGYFDTCYELERYGRYGQPRAAALDRAPAGHGIYAELALGLDGLLTLAAILERQQHGDGGTLTLRGEVPGPGRLHAGLLYRRSGSSAARLFRLEDSFLVAELRVQISPLLYLAGHYGRIWRLADPPAASDPWRSATLWGLGLGGSLAL